MPIEKRDPVSKAKLFVPTTSERTFRQSQRDMQKGLEDIDKMKKELQNLIDKAKKK